MAIDLMPGFGAFTAGGLVGTSTATFNSGNKSAAVVLSNSDLTAFGDNVVDDQGVYATGSQTTSKYYFEFVVDAQYGSGDGVAVRVTNDSTLDYINGNPSNALNWNTLSGNVRSAGSLVDTIGSVTAGSRGQFAVDLTNSKGWVRPVGANWNDDAGADPATNTGGYDIPAGATRYLCFYIPGAGQISVKFNASGWVGSPPSGFVEWP